MFVKALEHFKCDELTKAPCQLLPKIGVLDQYMKVKVAEIFWGAPAPQAPPQFWGASPSEPPCAIMLGPESTR